MSSSTSKTTAQDAPRVGSISIYETDDLGETTSGGCVQACSKIIIDVSWWKNNGKETKLVSAANHPSKNIQIKITFHIEHACGGSCPAVIPVVVNQVEKPSGLDAAGWHSIFSEEELLFEVKWAHSHDEEGHLLAMGCVGVRWCTEKGSRNEDGTRLWQTAQFVPSKDVEGTTSTTDSDIDSQQGNDDDDDDDTESIVGKGIQDPTTIEGQREGAMLLVKRKTSVTSKTKIAGVDENDFSAGADMQVGDCVEILRHSDSTCRVYNWRSGAGVEVPWNTFLPIGPLEFCECPDGECSCVYVDFEKNLQYSM